MSQNRGPEFEFGEGMEKAVYRRPSELFVQLQALCRRYASPGKRCVKLLHSADAVAKRYRPWPKGLRTDSLPWFDSPLVQGASRLRYTDKAQVAATGPYWPKGARNKKKASSCFILRSAIHLLCLITVCPFLLPSSLKVLDV